MKNFRGFANEEHPIDLAHDVVLLYGRNAAGKTSIFNAVELLLTGSIRRLQHVSDLPAVLINARTPNAPAQLTLEVSVGDTLRIADATIENLKLPVVNHVLTRAESDLFLHAAYLQQADIRKLVTSDSAGLGDTIRSLALDDNVFRLEQALEEAGITRAARGYAGATRKLNALDQEARQLQKQVEDARSTIASIESVDPDQIAWKDTLQRISDKLKVPVDTDTNEAVRNATQKLDAELQKQLQLAIRNRKATEDLLQQGTRLSDRKKRADDSESLTRDVVTQKSECAQKLLQCDTRIAVLRQRLGGPELSASVTDKRLALIAALEHIQSIPNLDVCPVCDQAFTNLNSHILEKLSVLNAQQSSSEQTARKIQTDLDAELSERRVLARTLEELDINLRNLRADSADFEQQFSQFVEQFRTDRGQQSSLEEIRRIILDRQLIAMRAVEELTSLATELGRIGSAISAKRIRSADLRAHCDKMQDELFTINAKLDRARAAHDRLDSFVETAQEVRRRLSSSINDVMREFVMGRTKDAFEDLFRRLAKNPFFQVSVPDVRVKWHKPEVDWCAVYKERQFPGEAVFSQGELNSCAIAFFLALATSHTNGLQFLMLDDPVQNMDEIHIEEFANVLKFLKDILGWQIVVALHDQTVYHFLRRQLHPSSRDQSLISYIFEDGEHGAHVLTDISTKYDPANLIAAVA